MENKTVDILIIDDDPNTRKTFGKILKFKKYNVEEAGTSSEAISLAKTKFFNIAVIDLRLPDASGLEVLRAIREINEDTVVIMVTAYASIDSSIEAMNKGAYSYITKPVNMDQALVVIDRALEKQELSMENRRLLQELKEANKRLRKLDQLKSQFVANVSHEFKNPLTAIKESLGIILDGLIGKISPEQKNMLKAGKNNVERLIRLVTDLLDVSKIESGKIEMKREQFDVASLVDEILRTYERDISKKQITLKKNISQDIGLMWADKDKLTQVVINLLSNAIKYTPDKGSVAIKLEGSEKEIQLEISDTGPGIPKEDYGKIFDKFERITAEKQEGTGLGLPIAKDIVELHKGRIWLESEVGKGSRFIFILPRDLRKSDRQKEAE